MTAAEIEKALTLLSNEDRIVYFAVANKRWICYQASGLIGIFPTKKEALIGFKKKYHYEGDVYTYMVRPGAYNCHISMQNHPNITGVECRIEKIHRENLSKMREITLKSMLPNWHF